LEGMARFDELLHRATRNARAAQEAESSRSFATRAVAAREAGIRNAIASGISARSLENALAEALPNIPRADLHFAMQKLLEKLQGRATERPKPAPNKNKGTPPAKEPAKGRQATSRPDAPHQPSTTLELPPWANGSDKRDDETDEDYCLRKNLEGPPEAKRKFIGEHNT
ncbi:MAG: hypothetical protein M0Z99_06375, partial [Betaproteobacteria bacterium]|nr:hypothetical protein [Betaproteobacteria bacterium]